jgi:hypothetical protein
MALDYPSGPLLHPWLRECYTPGCISPASGFYEASAQVRHGPADDAGDLHLGDPDLVGDGLLGLFLEEVTPDGEALEGGEPG